MCVAGSDFGHLGVCVVQHRLGREPSLRRSDRGVPTQLYSARGRHLVEYRVPVFAPTMAMG